MSKKPPCPLRCDGDNPCGLREGHTGSCACPKCPHTYDH